MSQDRQPPGPGERPFADVEPIQPSEPLRARILASVDPATRFEGFVGRMSRLFDLAEEAARRVLASAGAAEGPGWEESGIDGVRLYHFEGGPAVAGADCGLVSLAPGTEFPRHRHLGEEWNLALSGAAQEDSGERWLPGDLAVREAGSVHGFRAVADEPFVFAVVLYGGIEVERS